jgi:hypothetical protein
VSLFGPYAFLKIFLSHTLRASSITEKYTDLNFKCPLQWHTVWNKVSEHTKLYLLVDFRKSQIQFYSNSLAWYMWEEASFYWLQWLETAFSGIL